MTPSLRTPRRNRALFVPFLPGVHSQNFTEVSKILEASKRYYGIVGDVPVILAQDETRIKPHVRWEPRRDTLIGFCGSKDGHTCQLGLELSVGSGEEGYSHIVDSFGTNYWRALKHEWDEHCRTVVGLVIGHANDGDSRRRKLMLADYGSMSGVRWKLDWDGWIFSGAISGTGDVYGLGDQDPPHNGKKLVNPLDRSTHPLILGDHHACLEHV
ncbi:hypothetical protein R1sor_013486 [Riccia sorocarpa]|uniref:Uncharacterized protein n=1 Tax=Riccia sorocarpa TaxID=122646 RepID=A0ABD3H9M6_9MARC